MNAPSLSPMAADADALEHGRLDVYTRLLQDRIVFLGTDANADMANFTIAQMLFLAAQDPAKPTWLYINSPAPAVTTAQALYHTMPLLAPAWAPICMGLGASMGQFLLCAGAQGKRYALPHARIMMHQPLGGVRGQASDIAIQAEQMAYTKKMLQERIAGHTGQTVETIESDSDRDRWFTADEAREYGIIDKVIVRRGEMH